MDNNVMVNAAERGNSRALDLIQNNNTLITPNQLREFLDVSTSTQRNSRRKFLKQNNIRVFGSSQASELVSIREFQKVFQATVRAGHGRGDAALGAFAKATGIQAVTAEGRLNRFFNNTMPQLGVPIRRL